MVTIVFGTIALMIGFLVIGLRVERATRWLHLTYVALGIVVTTLLLNWLVGVLRPTSVSGLVAAVIFALVQTFVGMGIGGGLSFLIGGRQSAAPPAVPMAQPYQPARPMGTRPRPASRSIRGSRSARAARSTRRSLDLSPIRRSIHHNSHSRTRRNRALPIIRLVRPARRSPHPSRARHNLPIHSIHSIRPRVALRSPIHRTRARDRSTRRNIPHNSRRNSSLPLVGQAQRTASRRGLTAHERFSHSRIV
jgi:hypothetical protein